LFTTLKESEKRTVLAGFSKKNQDGTGNLLKKGFFYRLVRPTKINKEGDVCHEIVTT
jgi:hypothetical protein